MLTHVYSKNYIEKNYDKLMESMEVVLKLPDRYFKGIVSLMDGLLNNDLKELTEYPSKIQCPALVIRGEEDGFTPRYMSDRIAEQIPHAEYAIIPDAGHVLIFEKYSSLNSILLGFLRKHYQKNEF
jgi:pimeloyl-ACP methyl ester carboxylesterase